MVAHEFSVVSHYNFTVLIDDELSRNAINVPILFYRLSKELGPFGYFGEQPVEHRSHHLQHGTLHTIEVIQLVLRICEELKRIAVFTEILYHFFDGRFVYQQNRNVSRLEVIRLLQQFMGAQVTDGATGISFERQVDFF